jgi:hypothetical protein
VFIAHWPTVRFQCRACCCEFEAFVRFCGMRVSRDHILRTTISRAETFGNHVTRTATSISRRFRECVWFAKSMLRCIANMISPLRLVVLIRSRWKIQDAHLAAEVGRRVLHHNHMAGLATVRFICTSSNPSLPNKMEPSHDSKPIL